MAPEHPSPGMTLLPIAGVGGARGHAQPAAAGTSEGRMDRQGSGEMGLVPSSARGEVWASHAWDPAL